MVCAKCHVDVIPGPEGGYVCGQCLYTVEPDGYNVRRREGLLREASERQERTAKRRASRSKSKQ